MSSRKSSQGSGGQQSSASSGASREANKQKKNSGSKSFGGTDKPKTWDEGDDAPQHTKSSLVATSTLTINPKAQLKSKKGVNVAQLTDALTKKENDLRTKERILQQSLTNYQNLELEYQKVVDSVAELLTELRQKEDTIVRLTVDLSKLEELNKNLEDQRKQVADNLAKVKDNVTSKHANLQQRCKETEEELKRMTQLHTDEVTKHEATEQQLVDVKAKLAKLQEKTDDYIMEESSKQLPKMKEMEDTISTLSTELNKTQAEFEKNKASQQTSAIQHQQAIDQMTNDHQRQLQKLEDEMSYKNIEHERNLKAAKEDAEKCMNWSQVKATESEGLLKQLQSTIDDLNAKMSTVKKENKDIKLAFQNEHQRCSELEIASKESEELIIGNNVKMKQMEDTIREQDVIINDLKSNMTKMEQELKELKESKLNPGNSHEENLQQGNDDAAGLDGQVQQLISDKVILEKQMQSQLLDSKKTIDMLKDKLEAEKSAMENVKIQLSESQSEVDKPTQDLIKEKTVTENAKAEMDNLMNQQQQLHRDKRILEQKMNEGYKEREDRITELEELIHDQVVELDKMEAAMKQTVANKQLLEKDYQKLTEYYNTAKKLVEDYENRLIAQEETISRLNSTINQNDENATAAITTLQIEREVLVQANQKVSREVARLMSVDTDLQNREIEIEKCKVELHKAEEELQTKEFMLNTYKEDFEQQRKDRENAHKIKEDEIRKVRIEMEQFKVQYQEKIQSLEAELQSYKGHSKKDSAAAKTPTQNIDAILNPSHPGVYKHSSKQVTEYTMEEYRRMKSDYDKFSEKYEKSQRELTAAKAQLKSKKGDLIVQLTQTVDEKNDELKTKDKVIRQLRANHQSLEQQYLEAADSVPWLEAELREKEEQIVKLTVDISNQDVVIKSNETCNKDLMDKQKQFEDNLTKVKDELVAKHASLRQRYKQAEEELKEVKQLHTDEILKRETAEQQLVGAKMELAELKQKTDEYVLVESSKQIPEMKQMEDTISTLTSKLDKMQAELEKSQSSQQASATQHRQTLKQMTIDHQQQVQKLEEDMRSKDAEYERNLRAAKEDAEKSMNWSQIKATESEGLRKQLQSTIDDLNAEMSTIKKENEHNKLAFQSEQQKCSELARQDHQQSPHDITYHSTTTPHDYSSKQHQSSYSPSMGPKYPAQHDPPVGHTNAEYHYQQQQQQQQELWQQKHHLQQMNQQEQSNPQLRGQGREMLQNQAMRAGGGDMYAGGIDEEIRIQADLQNRQQQQDEFESGLAFDPYLICHKCKRQFREGQLPEYRHHIDNCRQ